MRIQTLQVHEFFHRFADLLKDPAKLDRLNLFDPDNAGLTKLVRATREYAAGTMDVDLAPGMTGGVAMPKGGRG